MVSLFEKIHGIEAAAAIANSMGDVSEGLTYEQIEARFGFLDKLLPQDKPERVRKQSVGYDFHYQAHHRPPGMTEDGHERHRLLTTAIIEKGGRVTVQDLARVWARDVDPTQVRLPARAAGPGDLLLDPRRHPAVRGGALRRLAGLRRHGEDDRAGRHRQRLQPRAGRPRRLRRRTDQGRPRPAGQLRARGRGGRRRGHRRGAEAGRDGREDQRTWRWPSFRRCRGARSRWASTGRRSPAATGGSCARSITTTTTADRFRTPSRSSRARWRSSA